MKTPAKKQEANEIEEEKLSLTEKIKKEKEAAEKKKKKSIDAWAETGEKKSFGLIGFTKFTFPRLWRGSCLNKFIVIFNFLMTFVVKIFKVITPLILKYAIDAIICDRNSQDIVCPSEQQTYILIIAYAGAKFAEELINNLREIPYANMAASAEITIAHDVYDHI